MLWVMAVTDRCGYLFENYIFCQGHGEYQVAGLVVPWKK